MMRVRVLYGMRVRVLLPPTNDDRDVDDDDVMMRTMTGTALPFLLMNALRRTILLFLCQVYVIEGFVTSKSPTFSRFPLRASPQDDAGHRLCSSWDLRETKATKTLLSKCPELCEAIESVNLELWLQRAGRIPKQRLESMVARHPALLARALTSNHIEVGNRRITCAEFQK